MTKENISIHFIKNSLKNILARVFVKNTIGSYILQAEKALFAFIVLPLLASRLGLSAFGVFSTFLSLSIVAGMIVDWGLSQTAVKLLAIANNHEKPSIAGEVILARLTLAIPVICMVVALCFLVFDLSEYRVHVIFTVLTIFAVALSPTFIFQAEEKSFDIGVVLLLVRLSTIGLIAIYIKTSEDLNLAFAVYVLTGYMAVTVSWLILVINYNLRVKLTSTKGIRRQIVSGFSFAFANIGSSLYGNGSVFLFSLVSTSTEVGLFNLALTFTRSVSSISIPVSQSYLPKISRLYEESFSKARIAVRKAMIVQIVAALLLLVSVWVALLYVLPVVIHYNLHEVSQLIFLLSPTIVFTLISSQLVLFVIVPMSATQFYRNLVALTCLLGSISILMLGNIFHAEGAAFSILVVEMIVCVAVCNHSIGAMKKSNPRNNIQ